jgi:succinate dehydrogenase / fumarate reductase iron-sulfur subunit
MRLTLKIWRQKGRKESGKFVSYPVDNVNPDMSVLECLDV